MEKDSFENLLRNKVLQAESIINRSSDKESVWNAIQQKRQPQRKLYYMAAAIFFIITMVGVLYFRDDKTITIMARAKPKGKPAIKESYITETGRQYAREQIELPRKLQVAEQVIPRATIEKTPIKDTINLPKEVVSTAVVNDEALKTKIALNENRIPTTASSTIAPEFTVQFKRGKPTDEVELPSKEAITRLKKFKLGKDTSVFANVSDKQKGFFKIKF